MASVLPCLVLALACAACPALGSPILGVPVYHTETEPAARQDSLDFGHLVVTTASPAGAAPAGDDIVRLDSSEERSRFLVTLLMLQSLHDKPFGKAHVDPKLQRQLLADEEVMQDVLKLYETTQETKGKHYIKIPPKLMKTMRRKMKELLSD